MQTTQRARSSSRHDRNQHRPSRRFTSFTSGAPGEPGDFARIRTPMTHDAPRAPSESGAEGPVGRWGRTSWNLVGVIVIYVAAIAVGRLRLVLVPVLVALLLATQLVPLASKLERRGLPRLVATWLAMLTMVGGIVGVGNLVAPALASEIGTLGTTLGDSGQQIKSWLTGAARAVGIVGRQPVDLVRKTGLWQPEPTLAWRFGIGPDRARTPGGGPRHVRVDSLLRETMARSLSGGSSEWSGPSAGRASSSFSTTHG